MLIVSDVFSTQTQALAGAVFKIVAQLGFVHRFDGHGGHLVIENETLKVCR
jgi:hypothetical protein